MTSTVVLIFLLAGFLIINFIAVLEESRRNKKLITRLDREKVAVNHLLKKIELLNDMDRSHYYEMGIPTNELFFSKLGENLEIEADGGDCVGDFVKEMVLETKREYRKARIAARRHGSDKLDEFLFKSNGRAVS